MKNEMNTGRLCVYVFLFSPLSIQSIGVSRFCLLHRLDYYIFQSHTYTNTACSALAISTITVPFYYAT